VRRPIASTYGPNQAGHHAPVFNLPAPVAGLQGGARLRRLPPHDNLPANPSVVSVMTASGRGMGREQGCIKALGFANHCNGTMLPAHVLRTATRIRCAKPPGLTLLLRLAVLPQALAEVNDLARLQFSKEIVVSAKNCSEHHRQHQQGAARPTLPPY